MTEKVLSAGDEIDSYCTTCKLVLAHQIVALVDGKAEKVLCNTCKKQHKYRPNPPKSRKKKTDGKTTTKKTASKKKADGTTEKKPTRRRTKDPSIKWEETLAEHNVEVTKDYSMYEAFNQHDIIEHTRFGRGIVTEVREEGKMEVLFKDGSKILVFAQVQS